MRLSPRIVVGRRRLAQRVCAASGARRLCAPGRHSVGAEAEDVLRYARDLALLERFTAAQVPRYADLHTPTVIISGERDTMVSPDINARVLAATLRAQSSFCSKT